MIGKTVSHYQIVEKLGEGGVGVVYKAEDIRLKRTLALKFLSPLAVGSEEEKTRFLHEAQAASALNHPNIATIYEIDEADGQTSQEPGMLFMAMEHIVGQSLLEMIHTPLIPPRGGTQGGVSVTEGRPLPLEDTIAYAIQIAEGLAKAHAKWEWMDAEREFKRAIAAPTA